MQDKEEQQDKLYRNKLKEFKLPVSDKVFANIKKELQLENKKQGFGFGHWLLLFALVVGAIAGGYFIASPYFTNKNTVATTTVKTNSGTENKFLIDKQKVKTSETKTQTVTNNSAPILFVKENEANISNKEKIVVDNKTILSTGKNRTNTQEKNRNENTVPTLNIPKKKETSKTTTNKAIAKYVGKAESKSNSKYNSKNNSNTLTTATSKTENQNKTKDEVLNSYSEIKTDAKDRNKLDSSSTITSKPEVKQVETKKDSIKKKELLTKTTDSVKQIKATLPPVIDSKPKDNKISFFAGITGGPSLSFRTLTTGNNEGAANRKGNEKQQTTYNAGIEAGATLKNNLFVNIGIRLNNKSESYHIDGAPSIFSTAYNPLRDTLGNIILDSITHNPIGYDTVNMTIPAAGEYSARNTYQFLSIPIMIGYSFTIKDKLFIAPSVGISIDYLLSASSSWVDTKTNQVVEYTKSNGSFSSVTVSGKINLNIGWNITKKWSLVLQPGYTRSLQSIYKKGDELKLYPYSYDVNVGVRFKF